MLACRYLLGDSPGKGFQKVGQEGFREAVRNGTEKTNFYQPCGQRGGTKRGAFAEGTRRARGGGIASGEEWVDLRGSVHPG